MTESARERFDREVIDPMSPEEVLELLGASSGLEEGPEDSDEALEVPALRAWQKRGDWGKRDALWRAAAYSMAALEGWSRGWRVYAYRCLDIADQIAADDGVAIIELLELEGAAGLPIQPGPPKPQSSRGPKPASYPTPALGAWRERGELELQDTLTQAALWDLSALEAFEAGELERARRFSTLARAALKRWQEETQ